MGGDPNLEPTIPPDYDLNKYDCDVCGFTYYRRELKKRWDGALVCDADYEEKHERLVAIEQGGLSAHFRNKNIQADEG